VLNDLRADCHILIPLQIQPRIRESWDFFLFGDFLFVLGFFFSFDIDLAYEVNSLFPKHMTGEVRIGQCVILVDTFWK
jgi:hypothetical protein